MNECFNSIEKFSSSATQLQGLVNQIALMVVEAEGLQKDLATVASCTRWYKTNFFR